MLSRPPCRSTPEHPSELMAAKRPLKCSPQISEGVSDDQFAIDHPPSPSNHLQTEDSVAAW
jgi:hypothetical protein